MRITISNLSKKYQSKYALKDFSIDMEPGIYGLLGENGAGKTTLLNLFMGLLKPDAGEIYVNGKNVKSIGGIFWIILGIFLNIRDFMRILL